MQKLTLTYRRIKELGACIGGRDRHIKGRWWKVVAYTIRKSIVGSSVVTARWRINGIDYNTSEEFFDDKDYKSITRDRLRRLVKRTTEHIEDESIKMGKSFSITHLMPDRLVKLMVE